MNGINKVILIGNSGKDAELKYMPNGNPVANVSIATSESWTDKSTGEKKEKTEWHRLVFFNRIAEIAGEYIKKGAKVYVEGSLVTRKWQDQSGQDRYTTEIKVHTLQLLDSKPQEGMKQATQQPQNAPPNNQPMGVHDKSVAPNFDDEIPF